MANARLLPLVRWRRQVLCDPGDGMLIPTPFYGGFETDLEKRAGARCWEVQSSVGSGFHIGVPEMEAALTAAQRAGTAAQPQHLGRPTFTVLTFSETLVVLDESAAGVKIRGLIVANPNNPLGVCYTAVQLQEMIDFADQVAGHNGTLVRRSNHC